MKLVNSDHPALKTISSELSETEMKEVALLYPKLARLMFKSGGVGLAANQLGYTKRYFVWPYGLVMNPVILYKSDEVNESLEGCLSFPSTHRNVARHNDIKVTYYDEYLKLKEKTLTGLPAKIFQHEFDHLNGICIVD